MKDKIIEVVKDLNKLEKERLKAEGCVNSAFFKDENSLTKSYEITLKEKKNYFYIDFGSRGAFMIDKITGLIYNIKGYGKINKNKCLGYIQSVNENNIKVLHSKRYNYLR